MLSKKKRRGLKMVAQTKKKQDDVTKIIMKMLKKMSEYEGEKCFGGWGSGK